MSSCLSCFFFNINANTFSALTPNDIKTFFEPVFEQANLLKKAYLSADENKKNKIKMPFITVSI